MKYRELLRPSIGGFAAIALIGPATWLVAMPIVPNYSPLIAIGVALLAMVMVTFSAPRIEIGADTLRAGRIQIPLSSLGEVEVHCGELRRKSLGVGLDARAQLCTSPWIDCVLKIEVRDEVDPVPYLIISTRHPEALKSILLGRETK